MQGVVLNFSEFTLRLCHCEILDWS